MSGIVLTTPVQAQDPVQSTTPTPTATPTITPTPLPPEVALITTAAVKFRLLPAQTATAIATVPNKTVLSANAISFDARWVRVIYNDTVGWISTRFVKITDGTYDSLTKVGFGGVRGDTAPTINFTIKPQTPAGAPDAVFPGGCVEIAWSVANIDKVFFSMGGNTYQGVTGKETLPAEGDQCLAETTTFFLKVVLQDGSTILRPVTIRVVNQ